MSYSPDKVQFEGEEQMQPKVHSPFEEQPPTGLAKLLVDKSIAADKKSADVLLIALAVIFFLLMATILFFGFREKPLPEKPFQSNGYYSFNSMTP